MRNVKICIVQELTYLEKKKLKKGGGVGDAEMENKPLVVGRN